MNKIAATTHSRSKLPIEYDQHQKINRRQVDTEIAELRQEVSFLKKQLKESQAKKNLAIKQLSDCMRKNEDLQGQISKNNRKSKQKADIARNEIYKVEELHFLNRQLTSELESLRAQNQTLLEKLKHSTTVLQTKYLELENSTFSKISQAMKRIKKTVTYLTTLSVKELQRARSSLVQNLDKSIELLKGKHINQRVDQQVDQLMSPINVLQDQLSNKQKQLRQLREKYENTQQELISQRKINKQLIPQYKLGVEKLKKNLQLCRGRIAELESQKIQSKAQFEARVKEIELQRKEMEIKYTKILVQNKIHLGRLKQLQGEVEQQKQRLIDQNIILKKLYRNNQLSPSRSQRSFHQQNLSQRSQTVHNSRSLASFRNSQTRLNQPKFEQSLQNRLEKPHHSTQKANSRRSRESSLSRMQQQADTSQSILMNDIAQITEDIKNIEQTLLKQLGNLRQ